MHRRQLVQMLVAAVIVLAGGLVGYRLVFTRGPSGALVVLNASEGVTRTDARGHALAAHPGLTVRAQDRVEVPEGGQAVLGVGRNTRLTLGSSSSIRVLDADDAGVRVELENGRVQARVKAGGPPVSIENRGRRVTASDADVTVGTDRDGVLAVEPTRGKVEVTGVEGVTDLEAGSTLRAMPGHKGVVSKVSETLLLRVAWPAQEETRDEAVAIHGTSDPYASVQVRTGNAPSIEVRAGADGSFEAKAPLAPGSNRVEVVASDALGRRNHDEKQIDRKTGGPHVKHTEVVWSE